MLLLASFIGVLWILSAGVVFDPPGWRLRYPRLYGLVCAFLCRRGVWASWRVGRPLIELDAERYARESDLRFALIYVNEHVTESRLTAARRASKITWVMNLIACSSFCVDLSARRGA